MNINELNPNTAIVMLRADRAVVIPTYSITSAALELRDNAVAVAVRVQQVTSAAENQLAVDALAKLTNISKLFESERQTRKEPILAAGRQLDAAVKKELVQIETEKGRVSELISEFQIAERQRVQEEERLRQAELDRIERQRKAELDRIAREQAEAERIAREAREKADRDLTAARTKKQREEAAKSQAQAAESERQAQELAAANAAKTSQVNAVADQATAMESAPSTATRVAGQVFRDDWDIEVTNPYELAKFHPDCVKIEPLMGPIKKALAEGITLKGVKAKPKLNAGVRAAPARPALDI